MTKPTKYQLIQLLLAFVSAFILALFWVPTSNADSPGDLDITFNNTGVLTTSISGIWDTGQSIVIQSDGKIVVAAQNRTNGGFNENFAVVRYNSDGTRDLGFGNSGIVTTSISTNGVDYASTIAIQPDGRILVGGKGSNNDIVVTRYTSDGILDNTFNGTGIVTTTISGGSLIGNSIAIQSDENSNVKIIVAGTATINSQNYFAVICYKDDGSLDSDFNGTGIVTTAVGSANSIGASVAIQSDNKIVLAGRSGNGVGFDFTVARYNTDGSLDTSFNQIDNSGIVTTFLSTGFDEAESVAIQSDGKIVVAGDIDNLGSPKLAVVRYNSDGSLDSNFHSTGIITTSIGNVALTSGVEVQLNGKIVIGGSSSIGGSGPNFMVVRYKKNGELDTTFNSTGIVTTPIDGISSEAMALALQSDGKIVTTGFSYDGKIALVRYIGDPVGFSYLPIILKQP